MCSIDNIDRCITPQDCQQEGLYWYLNACHANSVQSITEKTICLQAGGDWYHNTCYEEEILCSIEHIDRCMTLEDCEQNNLYWYLSACNVSSVESITEKNTLFTSRWGLV